MTSPYMDREVEQWAGITQELIDRFPITEQELVTVVLDSWQSILQTRIGRAGYQIGKDIFPQPQIMGFFLHELIPLELEHRYPGTWSRATSSHGKDVVCTGDEAFSFEIKTSSDRSHIYGNRSHAQAGKTSKKDKSGYYLTINFGKFARLPPGALPAIHKIRFGWIDSNDRRGQAAANGQQANLSADVEKYKLKELYILK